ncbi:ead/Ea22-like family protein [Escherichia coli]|nr:ead/Ea22-like family protein [Escherichia coli]
MSKIDYQALRAKAEKATCGEWSLEYGESRFDGDDALIHREVAGYIPICRIEGAHPESGFDEDFQMEQQANAEFIAAANPATVLALLDEREADKKRIAELEKSEEQLINERDHAESALDDMYFAATGDRPEWSNCFSFSDAVDAVVDRIADLEAKQPSPVVPEEKPMPNPLSMYAVDAVAAIAEVRGWNACRAAMLKGDKS